MRSCLPLLFAAHLSLATFGPACAEDGVRLFTVQPLAESTPSESMDDAADDAEVWRNAAHPELSRIFATDKKSGLMVLDLSGKMIDFFPVGRLNNVDLRGGWQVDGDDKVLIAASDRSKLGVTFFMLDPKSLKVSHLESSFLAVELAAEPYGLCFYRSHKDNRLHLILTAKDGAVRQFVLTPNAEGGVDSKLVRSFAVGSITEGCVTDERSGALYLAEETQGIWRYGAEPEAGDARRLIAGVDGKHMVADIEGLTLAPSGEAGGYLVASVQGNSSYALISLPEEKLVARFEIGANPDKDIDAVTGTDGLAITVGNFGEAFPQGVLAVQDDANPGAGQNFKLVSWTDVLRQLEVGQ